MLNTVRSGTGDLVVLMHGVSNSSLWWSRLIEVLSPDHVVVAIDMLGHGLSERIGETDRVFDAAYEANVEQLADLVSEAGPATIIGHSMGGAIAAKIAARHPDLVASLIVLDPAWLSEAQTAFYADSREAMTRTLRWQSDPGLALAENMERRPHWDGRDHVAWVYGQQRVDLGVIRAGNVSFSEPWQDIVSAIEVPTYVITSTGEDCIITPDKIEKMNSWGKENLTVEVIEGASHAILPDRFELVSGLLREAIPALSQHRDLQPVRGA